MIEFESANGCWILENANDETSDGAESKTNKMNPIDPCDLFLQLAMTDTVSIFVWFERSCFCLIRYSAPTM